MDNPYFLFFSHFLKNPRAVGAAAPLSQGVIDQIVKHLKKRIRLSAVRVLEVGAGIGNVTKSITKLLLPQDQLDIVEINPEYCRFLKERFAHQGNVAIHCLSVIEWKPEQPYDFIISTLPFNSFEPSFVECIFHHYENILKPNGVLSYVEYMGLQEINLAFSKGERKRRFISEWIYCRICKAVAYLRKSRFLAIFFLVIFTICLCIKVIILE